MVNARDAAVFSDARILVAGVARNCERTVKSDILRLADSLRGCRRLSWLVVESDSSDKTADVLAYLENEMPNFRFLTLGNLREKMPFRTQRIAHCRNVYLDELRSNAIYSDIDYVVVADLDGINVLINADAFASCWSRTDWDVCTANQRAPYYDIWALRHPIWCPNDHQKQVAFLIAHNVPKEFARWAAGYSKMITIDEEEDWIEVDSAFGGLAVYRRKAIEAGRYFGQDEAGDLACEHVYLHNELRAKGNRIFINPRLVNAGWTPHSFQRTLKGHLCRYTFSVLRRLKKPISRKQNPE